MSVFVSMLISFIKLLLGFFFLFRSLMKVQKVKLNEFRRERGENMKHLINMNRTKKESETETGRNIQYDWVFTYN